MNDNLITLRYDGLDADFHKIELSSLAESLKGASKVISSVGNFTATQKFIRKQTNQEIAVYATGTKANCFSVELIMDFVGQHQILSGSFGATFSVILMYVLNRNSAKKDEMRHLKDALDKAIQELGNKDKNTIERLLNTIDKMADSLKPSVGQMVEPIGNSCKTLNVSNNKVELKNFEQADKDFINNLGDDEIIGLKEYSVYITELDTINRTAKIYFASDTEKNRIIAEISDPTLSPYIKALSLYSHNHDSPEAEIKVIAKATVKQNKISKLFIADIS